VRVPGWLEDCPLVWGVGVKIDGTDEPPPVQAETVTAKRTAPAAQRPAISHAPWAAMDGVRRIFNEPSSNACPINLFFHWVCLYD
jgi:hypothetical protein